VIDRVTRLATGPRTSGTGTISGVPPAHPYRDASSAGPVAAPPVPAAFAAPQPFSPPAPPAAPRTGVPRTTVAFGSTPIAPPVPVVPPVPAAARPPIPGTIEPPTTTPGSIAGSAPVAPAPAAPPPAPARPAAVAVSAAMSEKLSEIGLTPQQAEAVLALSREVVERVVWEVVPELAETIIREEIKRLTAAG